LKITGVQTTAYVYQLARCMGDVNSAAGRIRAAACLVELSTDEALTGIGICRTAAEGQIATLVDEMLNGEDPRRVSGHWQRMLDARIEHGQHGLISEATAVLDIALWDLKAKANDEPLWKTLGGSRPKANAYASGVDWPLTNEQLAEWYGAMARDFGLRGGKLKVGLEQDADMRRLGLMRDALLQRTAEPVLMIDADEFWSPKQAISKVRQMEEEFDLTWVEDPVRRWDFLGLRRVSDSIRAAVCTGENLGTEGDFLPHLHHHSANIIQISLARGGITGALRLADAAYGFELPVTLSASPGNIHAHLAAVMPYFMTMEVTDPLPPEGVFTTDVRIEDGCAVAGDRPGNGLMVERQALAKARADMEK
jgi:L-alanine-DL-glutamate epimerase-like enolase superfamily enzyme